MNCILSAENLWDWQDSQKIWNKGPFLRHKYAVHGRTTYPSLLGSTWFNLCVLPPHGLVLSDCCRLSVSGALQPPQFQPPGVLFCWAVIPSVCQNLPTAFYWEWLKWYFLGYEFLSYLHVKCITTRNMSFYKLNILKIFLFFSFLFPVCCIIKYFGRKKCTSMVAKKSF